MSNEFQGPRTIDPCSYNKSKPAFLHNLSRDDVPLTAHGNNSSSLLPMFLQIMTTHDGLFFRLLSTSHPCATCFLLPQSNQHQLWRLADCSAISMPFPTF